MTERGKEMDIAAMPQDTTVSPEKCQELISALKRERDAMLESIPVGVFVVDKKLYITNVNAAIQKLLGIKGELMLNKNIDEFLQTNGFFKRLLEEKYDIYDKDMTFRTFKGKLFCGVSVTQIKDGSSGFQGMIVKLKNTKYMYRLLDTTNDTAADFSFENILGASKGLHDAIKVSQIAAKSNSSILLAGESGTGKELFAQAIHNYSERRNRPFVAINCGAFPRGLIESELFGYEGGAYTGAKKDGQPGKFELAEGGTLFLDEIGDMPVDLQVSLLRVLQNKEIVRIGGHRIVKVDVRIIAATNKDVERAIAENTFRSDLYYRLNVFSINIPPLRERREDIIPLTEFFIKKHAHYLDMAEKRIDDSVRRIFTSHDWPGNVRELENIVERVMNVADGDIIGVDSLPQYLQNLAGRDFAAVQPAFYPNTGEGETRLSTAERQILADALKKHKGNLTAVAKDIGISRRALYRKLDKYNIDSYAFKRI